MAQTHEEVRKIYGEKIEAIARAAEEQAAGATYVVYLILDSTKPDPHGRFSGTPIYVGQTGRTYGRIKDHLMDALVYGGEEGSLRHSLAQLVNGGNLPTVQIVQICNCRNESLIIETNWAQSLLRRGYSLKNRRKYQNRVMGKKNWNAFVHRAASAGLRIE